MLVPLIISVLLGGTIVALVALTNRGRLAVLVGIAALTLTLLWDSIGTQVAVDPVQITLDDNFFEGLELPEVDSDLEEARLLEITRLEVELSEIATARTSLVQAIGELNLEMADFRSMSDPDETPETADTIVGVQFVSDEWAKNCNFVLGVDGGYDTIIRQLINCNSTEIAQLGWDDSTAFDSGGDFFGTGNTLTQSGSGNTAVATDPRWPDRPIRVDPITPTSAGDGNGGPNRPDVSVQLMAVTRERDLAMDALELLRDRENETRAGLANAALAVPDDSSTSLTERRGSLAHNIPELMTYGQSTTVRLVLVPEANEQPAAEVLGVADDADIEISDYMRATVTGSSFQIVQTGGSDRRLTGSRQAEWTWEVTPSAYGEDLRLLVTVEALVKDGDDEHIVVHSTYEETVNVDVSRWNRFRLILEDLQPMQITIAGILGILVVAIGLYFTLREKTARPKPEEPLRFTGGGDPD